MRGMNTSEHREERDQSGHEKQTEVVGGGADCLDSPPAPGRAESSGGGQLLPAARVLPASRALRCSAPRSPPGGT